MVTSTHHRTPVMRVMMLFAIVLVMAQAVTAQQKDCAQCHADAATLAGPGHVAKTGVVSAERALGVQDKGQVSNYLGNYGVLSNYLEYFNDAIHWPSTANTERQYCFGLGLFVASKGNVATSVLGGISEKVDWSPKAGSRGKIYSGEVTVTSADATPFLALSDNPLTWPQGYTDTTGAWVSTPGKRHWPGHFRRDIDPTSPGYGKEVNGEFVSDRDIYAVFDDANNASARGPIGIEVEQTGYSYGRPYAENALIWEFRIHNTSGKRLDSVYVGYQAIFRADYDNQDHIGVANLDPSSPAGQVFYIYDINNQRDGAWAIDPAPLGMAGLQVLETPGQRGITDFHYFTRDVAPKVDEQLWPVIASLPADPNLAIPPAYFHGPNRRFDEAHRDSVKKYFPTGAPINFVVATGPFSLAPGETVTSSVAVVMGSSGTLPNLPDTTEIMKNARTVLKMYRRGYQGSGPPKTPKVTAVPGDRRVTLTWDDEAESSVDALTGRPNFEGYKVYRSDDQGKTWGTAVTDATGSVIGYRPLKIFDLVDGVRGLDPAFNQWLGDDSGLKHAFVDSTALNGVEYWYCVTSYSKGNQSRDSLEQSYQSALGRSLLQSNTVSVRAGVKAQDLVDPSYDPVVGATGGFPAIGGSSDGLVNLSIVQPEKVTGDDYLITFVDSAGVGSPLRFNLYRIGKQKRDTTLVLEKHRFTDDSGDNLPVVDGFRLTVKNSASGVRSLGWTKVSKDTCTFDWRTAPIPQYRDLGTQIEQERIYTTDDIRITIDTTAGGGVNARWYDEFANRVQDSLQHLPIRVEIVTDPAHPVDITNGTWLYEFAVKSPWEDYRQFYYSPLGWDLVPGGKGYTAASAGFREKYVDILRLEQRVYDPVARDTVANGLWLQTNNFPDVYINANGDTVHHKAVAPSQGDQFTIRTYKPFRKGIRYAFSTSAAASAADRQIDLDRIRAVPDPYIVANAFETNQFGKRLMFTHLPGVCTISIYTVAGDHVADVQHTDGNGYEYWDLRSFNGQYIAYGLYVYVVAVPNGQKKVGRFLVIK